MGQAFPTPSGANLSQTNSAHLRFGVFAVDLRAGELRKSGIRIKLHAQPFAVLAMLLRRPNEVVTRQELQQELWAEDTFVDFEHGLNKAINKLRDALGDDAHNPKFVETLPGRGYRFVAPLIENEAQAKLNGAAQTGGPRDSALIQERGQVVAIGPWQEFAAPGATTQIDRDVRWKKLSLGIRIGLTAAVIVVLAFVAYTRTTNRSVLSAGNVKFTRLTEAGSTRAASISPDGQYLAYAATSDGKDALWVRNLATGNASQLLPQGDSLWGLTFSPDSNSIYFVRPGADGATGALHVMPITGGASRKVLSEASSPISFSPDGRQFAYEICLSSGTRMELRIANADGSESRLLKSFDRAGKTYQSGPSWSPDGRKIALALEDELYSVTVADGRVEKIHRASGGLLGRPAWLRADEIVFAATQEGTSESQLWTLNASTHQLRRLTNDVAEYGMVLETAKGGKALLTTVNNLDAQIWSLPAGKLEDARLITNGPSASMTALELPGGRLLTVASDGTPWSMDADGRNRLPFGGLRDISDKLVPQRCGAGVLLTSYEGHSKVLNVVKADGSEVVKRVAGGDRFGACSADGQFVYFANWAEPRTIWRVAVDAETPVKFFELPVGQMLVPPLLPSPDGKLIAYAWGEESPERPAARHVSLVSTNGAAPAVTLEAPANVWCLHWSPNGHALQYMVGRNEDMDIVEQPLAGGQLKRLATFPHEIVFDFSWSLDGKRLLLTRGRWNNNMVLLQSLR